MFLILFFISSMYATDFNYCETAKWNDDAQTINLTDKLEYYDIKDSCLSEVRESKIKEYINDVYHGEHLKK